MDDRKVYALVSICLAVSLISVGFAGFTYYNRASHSKTTSTSTNKPIPPDLDKTYWDNWLKADSVADYQQILDRASRYEHNPSSWHSPPSVSIGQGFGVGPYDYVVFQGGKDNYYAKSGDNGQIMFEGSDASTVVQNAVGSLSKGTVYLKGFNRPSGVTVSENVSILTENNGNLALENGSFGTEQTFIRNYPVVDVTAYSGGDIGEKFNNALSANGENHTYTILNQGIVDVTTTINLTGYVQPKITILAYGTTLNGKTAGDPVIDTTGSQGLNWFGGKIRGNGTNTPSSGVLIAESSGRVFGEWGGDHTFKDVTFKGYFSIADVVMVASTINRFINCKFYNNIDPATTSDDNAVVLSMSENNTYSESSVYSTVGSGEDHIGAEFDSCSIQKRVNVAVPSLIDMVGGTNRVVFSNCFTQVLDGGTRFRLKDVGVGEISINNLRGEGTASVGVEIAGTQDVKRLSIQGGWWVHQTGGKLINNSAGVDIYNLTLGTEKQVNLSPDATDIDLGGGNLFSSDILFDTAGDKVNILGTGAIQNSRLKGIHEENIDPVLWNTTLQDGSSFIVRVGGTNYTEVTGKYIHYQAQTSAPASPTRGDVVMADGTNWDPGSGSGLYVYDNGTWNYLGGAGVVQ